MLFWLRLNLSKDIMTHLELSMGHRFSYIFIPFFSKEKVQCLKFFKEVARCKTITNSNTNKNKETNSNILNKNSQRHHSPNCSFCIRRFLLLCISCGSKKSLYCNLCQGKLLSCQNSEVSVFVEKKTQHLGAPKAWRSTQIADVEPVAPRRFPWPGLQNSRQLQLFYQWRML